MEGMVKGMQSIKLIVPKTSLSSVFKDWQIKALGFIPSGEQDPVNTLQVWESVNNGEGEISISRASVINFLEYLHGEDLLKGSLATGKGGKRFDYTYPVDREFFNTQVSTMLLGAIIEEYPDVDMFTIVRLVTGAA